MKLVHLPFSPAQIAPETPGLVLCDSPADLEWCLENGAIAVHLSLDAMQANAQRLLEFKSSPPLAAKPFELLAFLLHVCNNSELGVKTLSPDQRGAGGGGNLTTVPRPPNGALTTERVRVLIEELLTSTGASAGFRVWFFAQDRTFAFDDGFDAVFEKNAFAEKNAKRPAYPQKAAPASASDDFKNAAKISDVHRAIKTPREFIFEMLWPASGLGAPPPMESLSQPLGNVDLATGRRNPASVARMLHPRTFMFEGGGLGGADAATRLKGSALETHKTKIYTSKQKEKEKAKSKSKKQKSKKARGDLSSDDDDSISDDDDDPEPEPEADIFDLAEAGAEPEPEKKDATLVGFVGRMRTHGNVAQWTWSSYFHVDEAGALTFAFPFPKRVWDVSEFTRLMTFFLCALPTVSRDAIFDEADPSGTLDERGLAIDAKLRALSISLAPENFSSVALDGDPIVKTRAHYAKVLEAAEDKWEIRHGPEFAAVAERVFLETESPSPKAVASWHLDREAALRRKHNDAFPDDLGASFKANYFSRDLIVTDASLGVLGNFLVMFSEFTESAIDTTTHHNSIVLCFLASLGAYCYRKFLKVNIMFTGDTATGKSHILESLHKMLIPETMDVISASSPKALQAPDREFASKIMGVDETPAHFLGLDPTGSRQEGQGDPFFKSLLTSDVVTCDQNVQNPETGGRMYQRTKKPVRLVMFMLTNVAAHILPASFRSRSVARDVPAIKRKNHTIPDQQSHTGFVAEDKDTEREWFHDFFRRVQCLVLLVENDIEMGRLENVDMGAARVLLARMIGALEADTSQIRTMERMMSLARTCCIVRAVLTVFFTGTLKTKYRNERFSFQHVTLVQPFLYTNYEDTIYAFTALADQYVNPTESQAFLALVKARFDYDPATHADVALKDLPPAARKAFPDDASSGGQYFVVTGLRGGVDTSLEYAVGVDMAAELTKQFNTRTSPDALVTLLNSLKVRTHRGRKIVRIESTPARALFVLKSWIDEVCSKTFEDRVLAAVRSAQFSGTRPQRVVTALTYINAEVMMPHILRTVDLAPVAGRTFDTPRMDASRLLNAVRGVADAPVKDAAVVWSFERDVVDEMAARYWSSIACGESQYSPHAVAAHLAEAQRWPESYPEEYVAEYVERESRRMRGMAGHAEKGDKKSASSGVAPFANAAFFPVAAAAAPPAESETDDQAADADEENDDPNE